MGSSVGLGFKSRIGGFSSLIWLLVLTSCQTFKGVSSPFFQGELIFSQKNIKESSAIDIYVDQARMRIDLLSPLGRAVWVFVWKDDEYLALFPLSGKFFKEKADSFEIPQKWEWLIKDISWLRRAVLGEKLEGWVCDGQKKWSKKQFKKCSKNNLSIEWKKRKFQPPAIELNLKKSDYELSIYLDKKNKFYDPEKIFNISIPSHFERLKQLDPEGWKSFF